MMQPIFIVSVGRSGTTLLMQLLAEHPHIVAERHYPMEFRLLFAGALSAYKDVDAAVLARAVGAVGRYPLGHDREHLTVDLKEKGVTPETAMQVYAKLAAAQGKDAHFAVEKFWRYAPEGMDATRQAFPEAKYIILLRDPRDVILSARAFSDKYNLGGFVEKPGDQFIDVVRRYREIYSELQAYGAMDNAITIYYENLILDRQRHMDRIFAAIGAAPFAIGALPELADHRTSASDGLSIGRWKTEMDEAERQICKEQLGDTLADLGLVVDP